MPDYGDHGRSSIRLSGFDYALPGAYFVTICAHKRSMIFGTLNGSVFSPSVYGKVAIKEWFRTAELRDRVILYEDEFILMPNHLHGVIRIDYPFIHVGARRRRAPTRDAFGSPRSGTLGTIIRSYKSAVTRLVNQMRGTLGMPVWQRNYSEHIVRGEAELRRVQRYIIQNPARWDEDRYFTTGV